MPKHEIESIIPVRIVRLKTKDEIESLIDPLISASRALRAAEIDASSCGTDSDRRKARRLLEEYEALYAEVVDKLRK